MSTTNKKEIIMNWDRIEGNWKQISGKVNEKWGKLTNDHLNVIDGKREQLLGKVQELYGISKDEANTQIDEFAKAIHNAFNKDIVKK